MLRELLSRIQGSFRRRRLEQEFDDEVRSHLEMLKERFIARGMDPAEAFYAARRQFGGVTQVKQDFRERRAVPAFYVLLEDVRQAFSRLRKAKRFTAAAALTLALGIGAGAAVFAVLDTVVLRPLPYPEPGRLMAFRSVDQRGTPHILSYPDFFDFRKHNRVFEHLVCYRDAAFTLTDSLPPIQVAGAIVSWDLFPMLGVQPALGRGFLPEEENPGTHTVLLSHRLWKSRFGGDPGILGRAVRINGVPFTVIGVGPPGFQFPAEAAAVELWVTLSEDATARDQRGARMLDAIGRLKPGVSARQAQSEMDQLAGALARQYPGNKNVARTLVLPELRRLAGSSLKPLLVLAGAVAMLLLIACVNTANLLLARNAERAREFALRTALGASRLAIVRQMLTEGLALGLLGAGGGVLLSFGALKAVLPLAGDSVPRLSDTSIDARVLAFSIALAVLTSVLFSFAPAVQAARVDPAGALKEGARTIARGHDRFRSGLVVVQITLGLVLLVAAELLAAGFLHLVHRDLGFRAGELLTFDVGLAEPNVTRQIAFCDRMLEHLRAIPGVQAAATGTPLPLEGHQMRAAFDIEQRPAAAPDRPRCDTAIVTPGYFRAMGIPLLKGRDFSERDDAQAAPILVVNQAFARKYFPGEDVIGKRIRPGLGPTPAMREIVGVVGDAKQAALGADPDPIYYYPYKQLPWFLGTVVLRTVVPPLAVESAARAAVASLDRHVAIHGIRTGKERSAAAIAQMQFVTTLMGGFAIIALLLAGAGLYGVLSYAVARRRGEIGVRIALGAAHKEVLGLVFRQAMSLVAAGLVLGLAGAAAASRVLGTMIYGIRPGDPLILAGACCVLVITAIAAAYVPAARAASVDPMQALRSE